ncbi:MAG TPA: crotonase/enoyl-CoA hydratase family protein [Trebonia sp.]|jgi:enoyl-CoA hydratase/carnithine racemase|nr:crotonase/enoyl-CoA hydratase family protein [Trebonia sp.]
MAEEVLYSVADGVATITLNRPDQLNALNRAMYEGLIEAFDQTDRDDKVRAVVVTGTGRAFCAGADLSGGAGTFDYGQDATPQTHRDPGGMLVLRIFRSLKPVIAAINGPAVGVGITMTLPMDIRIMADSARVGFVFARRGIVPDGASSWFLPRIVGISQALEWCLTGRLLSSEEALAGGLARTVCPVAEVLPLATRLAAEISASVAPVSAVLTRHLLWQMLGADHPMVTHRIDSRAIYETGRMADSAEGVAAFLEKREPSWTLAPSKDLPDWFPWRPEPPFAE